MCVTLIIYQETLHEVQTKYCRAVSKLLANHFFGTVLYSLLWMRY
jgi:hypothetical protein